LGEKKWMPHIVSLNELWNLAEGKESGVRSQESVGKSLWANFKH
jgi:hypothetical protein